MEKDNKKIQWELEGHMCERCGKTMDKFYGSGRFCSQQCANSRKHTDKSRLKTYNSLKKFFAESNTSKNTECELDFSLYIDGTKELYLDGIANYRNLKYYKLDQVEGIDFVKCPYCSARMSEVNARHLRIHDKTKEDAKNDFGGNYKFISQNTLNKRSDASSETQRRLVEDGKHIGWQSRKVRSYAELFWEKDTR